MYVTIENIPHNDAVFLLKAWNEITEGPSLIFVVMFYIEFADDIHFSSLTFCWSSPKCPIRLRNPPRLLSNGYQTAQASGVKQPRGEDIFNITVSWY
jgi:hypothetical protein